MADYTENLNLRKVNTSTEGTQTFNLDTYLNNNWEDLDEFAGKTITTDKLVNNLASTESGFGLDSRQGKVIGDRLNVVEETVEEHTASLSDKAKQTDLAQLSNPSLLINDCFQVWQRGTNFSNVDNTKYTADRWAANNSISGALQISQSASGLTMTWSSLATGTLSYYMESNDKAKLVGKKITCSISVGGTVYTGTVIIVSANTYIDFSLSTKTFTTSTNSSNTTLFVYINHGNAPSGTTYTINYVKAEVGSIATPFVPRLYAEELALCQRYYETIPYFISPSVQGSGTTANIISVHPYKVTKRISPTIVFKDNSGASGYCTRGIIGTSVNNTQPISANVISTSDMLIAESPSGLSANYIGFSATADSEIY